VRDLDAKWPALQQAVAGARAAGEPARLAAAEKEAAKNRTLRFNNRLDAVVALSFMTMVLAVVGLSVREWLLLLARRRPATLHETEPVWLPARAVAEGGPKLPWFHFAGLLFGLAKELSNEAALERAEKSALVATAQGGQPAAATAEQRYLKVTNERFSGVRRCC
jgi:hypothetical protein